MHFSHVNSEYLKFQCKTIRCLLKLDTFAFAHGLAMEFEVEFGLPAGQILDLGVHILHMSFEPITENAYFG